MKERSLITPPTSGKVDFHLILICDLHYFTTVTFKKVAGIEVVFLLSLLF